MPEERDPDAATSTFIEDFVQQHWDEEGTACYLSNLGSRLKSDLPESQKVVADGLREYLRRNPIVRVVQHPEVYQKIGAVPLSVDIPDRIEELFAKKATSTSEKQRVSYEQVFWNAFINPIDGEVRIVCVGEEGIEISDGQASEKKEHCYEITSQDLTKELPGSTISERVVELLPNRWADLTPV